MNNQNHARRVLLLQAIEDHIADTGRLPSTPELIQRVDIAPRTARADLDEMEKQGSITAVYKAPKNPTIYLPTYMYKEMRRGEKIPLWMSNYEFAAVKEIEGQLADGRERLNELVQIQRLLYSTGRTLEEAVGAALEILGVGDLRLPYEDPDSWDVSFTIDGKTIISDIKGKSKWADKPDVAQLQQWLLKYVDQNPDTQPENVVGLLIINHFKDLIPTDRWPEDEKNTPISEAGIRYLKVGGLKYLITADLFHLVRQIKTDKLTKEVARKKLTTIIRDST